MKEPVAAPKIAKPGERVPTLLREAEAQGKASTSTTFKHAHIQVPAMSFLEASSNVRTSVATDIQQMVVGVPAKASVYSHTDMLKKTILFR